MKARTIIIFIAVFLLIAGTTLCVVGLSMVEFNIHKIGMYSERISKEYNISAAEIHKISVSMNNEEIVLKNSADEKIYINYFESDREKFEIENKNGTLSVSLTNDFKWYEYLLSFNIKPEVVEISVPTDFDGDIVLKTSNGEITLKNISAKGDISVVISNGRITADDISCENLSLTTSNGSIRISAVIAEYKIYMKTSNGSIKGDIAGDKNDFTIKSRTSNGRNNLPKNQTGGDKMLEVYTSNGSIDIVFGQ